MRLWNYKKGRELASVNCREHLNIPEHFEPDSESTCGKSEIKSTDESDDDKEHDEQDETNEEEANGGSEEDNKTTDKSKNSECRVDVKCLSYYEEKQLLAVAFEGYPYLHFSEMSCSAFCEQHLNRSKNRSCINVKV